MVFGMAKELAKVWTTMVRHGEDFPNQSHECDSPFHAEGGHGVHRSVCPFFSEPFGVFAPAFFKKTNGIDKVTPQ
jgi:hypothetical protein